jgi:uncharacterized protein (TIGR03435 family)
MPDANDMELLGAYARNGSETAFAELVRRHIPLVYSAALRHVGMAAQAEEITQVVFVILARKAGSLRPNTILEGWLYETTRLTALSFLRGERRRQFREQEAYMQSSLHDPAENSAWQELPPFLDEAMGCLGKKDRDAVILRFFKEKSVRDVAAAMQVNEAAAQRRILRALEKLRKFFARRGVVSTTAIIAETISANSVQAAPAGLAKAVSAAAIAKGAAASTSTLTLIKGALKLMAWTKAKTVITATAVVLLTAGTTTLAVKKIDSYARYRDSWRTPKLNSGVVDQSYPQVRILPTRFPRNQELWENNESTKCVGLDQPVSVMMWVAYQWPPARVVFTAPEPNGRYDFITSLPDGSYEALQRELKNQFGLSGRVESRDTDVLVLKVRIPNASGLKPPVIGSQSDWSGTGQYVCEDRPLSTGAPPFEGLHRFLEQYFNIAVVDETGLTNRFSINLKWNERGPGDPNHEAFKKAMLDQLGLELVPANRPIDMLVVEKAK